MKNSEKYYRKIRKKLEEELDEYRFEHTLGVAKISQMLAVIYDVDADEAYTAGLLHDCAKNINHKQKIKLCQKNDIEVTDFELDNPSLLHSKVGAIVAKTDYDINDENILAAIRSHTTGRPDMSMLEKIVFVADYIEPGRDERPNLNNLRKLAFEDLDLCVENILYDTLHYLEGFSKSIDPMTQLTYDFYHNYNLNK